MVILNDGGLIGNIIHHDKDTPEFGDFILFVPHIIPLSDSYELWIVVLPLYNYNYHLVDPFPFEPYSTQTTYCAIYL